MCPPATITVLLPALKVAINTVAIESQLRAIETRRAVAAEIHVKQFEDLGEELEEALTPLFRRQIVDASKGIQTLVDGETASRVEYAKHTRRRRKTTDDDAAAIAQQVFDPRQYDEELIDRALPVLAKAMEEAAIAQLLQLGVDPRKSNQYARTKATSATEWLAAEGLEPPPGVSTELPVWMIDAIDKSLRDTFEQDYWLRINDTTQADIQGHIKRGLNNGDGFAKIAREIKTDAGLGFEYYKRRSLTITRTEGGNALNSARVQSIDALSREIPEAQMRSEWLSILGNTTRDTHAELDGVPADADGMWELGGVRVPWPAHYSLPVEERVNCQCTVVTAFGISDEEAQQRIDEFNERVQRRVEDETRQHRSSTGPRRTDERCNGFKAADPSCVLSKSEVAKANSKRVGKDVQRYSEERNEADIAQQLGRTAKAMDDNLPHDIEWRDRGQLHGIELKTMVDNGNNKITMKRSAMERKAAWEKDRDGIMHTLVIDDSNVIPGSNIVDKAESLNAFLETGDETGFDFGQRRMFYRRGYGSFRVGGMHEVTGGMRELRALLRSTLDDLPVGAK